MGWESIGVKKIQHACIKESHTTGELAVHKGKCGTPPAVRGNVRQTSRPGPVQKPCQKLKPSHQTTVHPVSINYMWQCARQRHIVQEPNTTATGLLPTCHVCSPVCLGREGKRQGRQHKAKEGESAKRCVRGKDTCKIENTWSME